jgi:transcriptional regulator with XRE-family HTH domain
MDSRRSNSIVGQRDQGKEKHKQNKKGMTQKQLAELSGVPVGRIRRIESGAQSVTLDDVVKLARALGRDPLDMVRDTLIRSGEHHPRQ